MGKTVNALLGAWMLSAVSAPATVFWPVGRPGASGGANPSVEVDQLLSEPVVINGFRTTMKLGTVHRPYDELLREFQKAYPKELATGPDSMRLDFPTGKLRKRYLFIRIPGESKTTVAEMELPEKLPPPGGAWPRELPIPPGATLSEVVFYPERRAVYAAFSGVFDPAASLRSLASGISGEYSAVSGEAFRLDGGRGELFLSRDARKILWVNYHPDGSGVIYTRPL